MFSIYSAGNATTGRAAAVEVGKKKKEGKHERLVTQVMPIKTQALMAQTLLLQQQQASNITSRGNTATTLPAVSDAVARTVAKAVGILLQKKDKKKNQQHLWNIVPEVEQQKQSSGGGKKQGDWLTRSQRLLSQRPHFVNYHIPSSTGKPAFYPEGCPQTERAQSPYDENRWKGNKALNWRERRPSQEIGGPRGILQANGVPMFSSITHKTRFATPVPNGAHPEYYLNTSSPFCLTRSFPANNVNGSFFYALPQQEKVALLSRPVNFSGPSMSLQQFSAQDEPRSVYKNQAYEKVDLEAMLREGGGGKAASKTVVGAGHFTTLRGGRDHVPIYKPIIRVVQPGEAEEELARQERAAARALEEEKRGGRRASTSGKGGVTARRRKKELGATVTSDQGERQQQQQGRKVVVQTARAAYEYNGRLLKPPIALAAAHERKFRDLALVPSPRGSSAAGLIATLQKRGQGGDDEPPLRELSGGGLVGAVADSGRIGRQKYPTFLPGSLSHVGFSYRGGEKHIPPQLLSPGRAVPAAASFTAPLPTAATLATTNTTTTTTTKSSGSYYSLAAFKPAVKEVHFDPLPGRKLVVGGGSLPPSATVTTDKCSMTGVARTPAVLQRSPLLVKMER